MRFVIVGAASAPRYAEYERTMRGLARELLGDRLVWAGERSPIQPALAALDLVMHCAENEPFGRVIIEAMALRIPVVAFRGGGVIVGKGNQPGPGGLAALKDAGMIFPVTHNDILGSQHARDGSQVGGESGGMDDGLFLAHKSGQALL